MRFIRTFGLCILLFGCSKSNDIPNVDVQDEIPIDDSNIVNILFIGNSLTFFNQGIDHHVQQFYDNDPTIPITNIEERTAPGYTLEQHLNNAGTRNLVTQNSWDIIILQENGDHARTNPSNALASFHAFKELLSATPTRVFLFMTWGYTAYPEMTAQLEKLYNQAATETGYTVLPVGLGWQDVANTDPDYQLLSNDGVHPSLHGTYFSSAMIFEILSGQNVTLNSYAPLLPAAHTAQLKQFAHDAVELHYQ